MSAPAANDFLLGGGGAGKSASFLNLGASITGTVTTTPEVRQQNDPATGKPKTWDNGDPMWQIVVTLQTDERSHEIEGDDGIRYLYVKGSKKPESKSMHAAVAGAVQNAGAAGIEVGGKLTVTYVSDGVRSSPAFSPPKQFSAVYVTAAVNALGVPQAAKATPVAASGLTQAEFPHLSPEQLAGVQAAGLSAAQVKQMFPPPTG